jgi:hypothetical protein
MYNYRNFGIFHGKVELDAVTTNAMITGAVKIEGRGVLRRHQSESNV